MKLHIREERLSDYTIVNDIIVEAFKEDEHSDRQEQELVKRLRKSKSFIPELSLVAEFEGAVVGHILLTEIKIISETERYVSLALAPIAVHPTYQGEGIGGALILHAHKVARSLGYASVVLLGHQDYYPRFGYRPCHELGISLPFEAPAENCMAIELIENGLQGISGVVEYDPIAWRL